MSVENTLLSLRVRISEIKRLLCFEEAPLDREQLKQNLAKLEMQNLKWEELKKEIKERSKREYEEVTNIDYFISEERGKQLSYIEDSILQHLKDSGLTFKIHSPFGGSIRNGEFLFPSTIQLGKKNRLTIFTNKFGVTVAGYIFSSLKTDMLSHFHKKITDFNELEKLMEEALDFIKKG